ncbi:MAG: hypothetical protein M1817_002943 [Caeruleum heppii]|nr:MAG: hypothetical protein M1817_002943 [Caeruleum heppii]
MSPDPSAGPPVDPSASKRTRPVVHPVSLNPLRYTVSPKEYALLHSYLLSRSSILRRRAPSIKRYEDAVESKSIGSQYNVSAVRDALRVLLGCQAGLTAWEVISGMLSARGRKRKTISLSLSLVLLLHRLLYRFFTLLRANLLLPSSSPFRRRNPRLSSFLTSTSAPAVGASISGFMLGICPTDQFRVKVAIWALVRAAEGVFSLGDLEKWWGELPWWFGSWLVMPVSCGQLLHAFVFDRDCFPKAYGDFIVKYDGGYIQRRPDDYPSTLPWPGTYEIVDGLANIAKLKHPKFISPTLFPNHPAPLPPPLTSLAPIVSPAHPVLTSLSCATLHPADPSCLRAYVTYYIRTLPALVRFFTVVLAVFSLPRYMAFLQKPSEATATLVSNVVKLSLFVGGAVGTSFASICLFANVLPTAFLPTRRYFLSGFLGGLFSLLSFSSGRGQFLYTLRESIDSCWKVGKKHGWWRGIKGGDILVFVASLMVMNAVYDMRRDAMAGVMGRVLQGARGKGWGREGKDAIKSVSQEMDRKEK